jgi:hypothetical protein
MTIGIMTPLYGRPDLARMVALQFNAQIKKPDLVVFYQNGPYPDYEWAIKDLVLDYNYQWIYNPQEEPVPSNWYKIPLEKLIEANCDYYFWCDHDDIYLSNHVELSVQDLENTNSDLVVNSCSGILTLNKNTFQYQQQLFGSHSLGGMSSSMAFNKRFAQQLLLDFCANLQTLKYQNPDSVLSNETAKGFRILHNASRISTIYVSHANSYTSKRTQKHWPR